jgi:hypothetical protein
MEIFHSQQLQSLGPRYGPVGGSQLKNALFNRFWIVCFRKQQDLQWFMCCNGILERIPASSAAEKCRIKFEKIVVNSRKLEEISRNLCLRYTVKMSCVIFYPRPSSVLPFLSARTLCWQNWAVEGAHPLLLVLGTQCHSFPGIKTTLNPSQVLPLPSHRRQQGSCSAERPGCLHPLPFSHHLAHALILQVLVFRVTHMGSQRVSTGMAHTT